MCLWRLLSQLREQNIRNGNGLISRPSLVSKSLHRFHGNKICICVFFFYFNFVCYLRPMAKVMFLSVLVSLCVCVSVCLSVFVYLSVCLDVWVSVCLLAILRETHELIFIIFKMEFGGRLFHACLYRFTVLNLGAAEVCALGLLLVYFCRLVLNQNTFKISLILCCLNQLPLISRPKMR